MSRINDHSSPRRRRRRGVTGQPQSRAARSVVSAAIPFEASVLPRETETVHSALIEEDVYAVFVLSPERAFTFQKTERLIDAAGFETGRGECSVPAPLPEAA